MTSPSTTCPPPSPLETGTEASLADLLRACTQDPFLGLGQTAVLEALREVMDWAMSGQQADETASVWLAQLRWARAAGLPIAPDAPLPPPAAWEKMLDVEGSVPFPTEGLPDLAAGLGRASMQYPARTEDGGRRSDTFLPLLAPLAFYPQADLVHLGQLAVNLTALTHGHPEALATGLVWVLALRLGARAESREDDAVTDPRTWIRRGLPEARNLLLDAPQEPRREGLMAAMAATGGSLRALQGVIAAAPATRAVLAGDEETTQADNEETTRPEQVAAIDAPRPAHEDQGEPVCVRTLRRAARGEGLGPAPDSKRTDGTARPATASPLPSWSPELESVREAVLRDWTETAEKFWRIQEGR